MDLENTESTAKGADCPFEPERHHCDALSSASHFPELPVVFVRPLASSVFRSLDHFTTRNPRSSLPLAR
jgi:hypothetical protein